MWLARGGRIFSTYYSWHRTSGENPFFLSPATLLLQRPDLVRSEENVTIHLVCSCFIKNKVKLNVLIILGLKMKIAIIGQSPFATEVYRSILRNGHQIVGIFTVLDKNGKQVKDFILIKTAMKNCFIFKDWVHFELSPGLGNRFYPAHHSLLYNPCIHVQLEQKALVFSLTFEKVIKSKHFH